MSPYTAKLFKNSRRQGGRIDEEVLAHSENMNLFGAIEVDIDAEIAQLGPPVTGH